MLYFDTSFLVPLLFQESTSTQIDAFIRRQRAGELTVSHWTRLEFSSVLAREVRMGQLDRDAARDAEARFDALVAESFAVILPSAADFELSRISLGNCEKSRGGHDSQPGQGTAACRKLARNTGHERNSRSIGARPLTAPNRIF